MHTSPASIGVINGGTKTGRTIRRSIAELGHRAVLLKPRDISLTTRGNVKTHADVDAFFNWESIYREDFTSEYYGVLRALEETAPVMNGVEGSLYANHKPAGLSQLSNTEGVNIPTFQYSGGFPALREEADKWGKLVHKPVYGGGGSEVHKVDADEKIYPLSGPQAGFLQEFVETGGGEDTHSDVRAFVVGEDVVAAMQRDAPEEEWRTNISLGGEGSLIELPPEAEEMAVKATQELGLDVVGIDLIQREDGEWFVLELNAPAGFAGLHEATGVNVAPYIAAHILRSIGHEVPTERVEESARNMELTEKDEAPGNEIYPVETGEEYTLVGYSGRESVPARVAPGLSHNFIDTDVASSIGAGPIRETSKTELTEGSVPMVPVTVVNGGDDFMTRMCITDLSDFEADAVFDSPYFVSKSLPKLSESGTTQE